MSDELEAPTSDRRRIQPKRRARRKRRHTVARVVAVTSYLLALVVGLSAVYLVRDLDQNIQAIQDPTGILDEAERPDKVDVEGPKDPLNVLLIGSDREEDGQRRSDTTILLHVSADRKSAYGVSIPRDTMVERPDCGPDAPAPTELTMFNAAYSTGGALCTQKTVEELTDVRVDATVEVDFEGFVGMVNAIDGVEICVPKEVVDDQYSNALPAGTYKATGWQALSYVRERHQLSSNGDLGRMKRQQAFLASMANKIVSAETLTNFGRVYDLADEVTKSVTVSADYANLRKLTGLGLELNSVGLDEIQFLSAPSRLWVEVDANRVVLTDDADDLWALIRNDEPLTREFAAGSLDASKPGGSVSDGANRDRGSKATERPSPSDPPTTAEPDVPDAPDVSAIADENGLCA